MFVRTFTSMLLCCLFDSVLSVCVCSNFVGIFRMEFCQLDVLLMYTSRGCAGTEAVVMVSSAISKNGVLYVMPTLSADAAYLLTRISDIIRLTYHYILPTHVRFLCATA